MTTSSHHSTHKVAEFPDTCVTCTQEWYGIEDVTLVDVTLDAEGNPRPVRLTDVRTAREKRSEGGT